ncbi:MAG: transketolase [Bryobacteraceae bacterium]|nr:transketolase [Bryobacteraceae bacterium]
MNMQQLARVPPRISVEELRRRACGIRRRSLQMIHRAGFGHPGSDLSCADILAVLYFAVLRLDPADPRHPGRDRFILSKGHSSASYYATLAAAGFFPEQELDSYLQPLSAFNGHPDRNKVPGVEASTGALGHGLPIGVGAALAAKMDGAPWRVFVLTGDGELQEGSNWEAAMAAAHHRLDNLVLIVDRNRLQQGDATERTVRLEPLGEKFRAFGWGVAEVDGHDHGALLSLFERRPLLAGQPSCVIAHTLKGKGVSFMEGRVEWHHGHLSSEQLAQALFELGEAGLD